MEVTIDSEEIEMFLKIEREYSNAVSRLSMCIAESILRSTKQHEYDEEGNIPKDTGDMRRCV